MKKKIVSCLIICVVLVLSYFYAYIDDNACIYNENSDAATFFATGTLSGAEEITQNFYIQGNSLDGINIKVELLGHTENVLLHYMLLDENLNTVYDGKIPAKELDNHKFNTLPISKITNTQGKKYTLVLREENTDLQNGVSFYLSHGRENGQDLIIKGNATDATLVARTIYNRFDLETYVVLLGMITFVVVFLKILYKMFK